MRSWHGTSWEMGDAGGMRWGNPIRVSREALGGGTGNNVAEEEGTGLKMLMQ